MGNIVSFDVGSGTVVRQYAAKLGKVVVVVPEMKSITDTAGSANSLNKVNDAGFPDPDNPPTVATGAAGNLTGTYYYYVTFYDSNTDSEGNPSAISAAVNPSADSVDVTLTPITNEGDNDRVTHFRIYRNLNGGNVYYYRVAEVTVATTVHNDDLTDATIAGNDTLELDNNAPAADTYGHVITHKSYMFMFGPANQIGGTDYDHRAAFCKVGNPDQWPGLNENDFAKGMYGVIRALHPIGDSLLMYKDRCIIRWVYDEDPSGVFGDGNNQPVNTERGAVNQRTVVNYQGTHIVMDREGIYMTRSGEDVTCLEYDIERDWKRINWAQRAKFCATWDRDRCWFFVALDEDTECHYAFVFDILAFNARKGQRLYVEKYDFGIRDAERIYLGNTSAAQEYNMVGRKVPAVIDDKGRIHVLAKGYRDGVSPILTADGTVVSSTTTTVTTDPSDVYTTTNANGDTVDVVDQYIRWKDPEALADANNMLVSTDYTQPYRITAAVGQTLTFTPALPFAPPVGTEFTIGGLPDAVYKSPQFAFGQPDKKKKAGRITLESQSKGMPHTIKARISNDRLGAWETVEASDSDQSMWTCDANRQNLTIKLGGDFDENGRLGATHIPAGSRYFRYMQLELDATGKVDTPAVIDAYQIEIDEVDDAAT